jgi:hypothetical protein
LKKIPNLIIFSASYLFILSAIAAFTTLQGLSMLAMFNAAGKSQGMSTAISATGLGGILFLFGLLLILIPAGTCVITALAGIGLLKRKKWSRDASSIVFGLGLLCYIAVALLDSDRTSSALYLKICGFLNAICLSLGVYVMRFNREVHHYFDELDS